MAQPRTMFDKIWDCHVVATEAGDETLIYIDRCLVHEGARHSFEKLEAAGHPVARPRQVLGVADHYAPTDRAIRARGVEGIADAGIRRMIELMAANTSRAGIPYFGVDDARQGILHVVGPELGLTQPGMIMAGADSHSSTHGAFGCFAFGIGASETAHILATQTLWQRRPRTLRVTIDGTLGFGVTAKDVILSVIAAIGVDGGVGHAIEYAGSTIRGMSMEQRMTVCNMSIEAGARAGMIAPDDTTFAYMAGRPFSPRENDWDAAVAYWRSLPTDPGAAFDREVALDAAAIAPMVSWGINPEQSVAVDAAVPAPEEADTAEACALARTALYYMALAPGRPIAGLAIDRVFIGSCTNGRIEDLRAAAEVARRGRAKVPAWVVPGSMQVKRAAEAEKLDQVFEAAGFEWREPGCSLCTAINGDVLAEGERCASTSNRNFRGRQGPNGRTHLMSPAMAAAAALAGAITDVRSLG